MDVCFTSFGHEGYLNCNIDFLLSKEKGVRNKLAFFFTLLNIRITCE